MSALEQITGANVYLHPRTQVFTNAKTISIASTAVGAITFLVVGILATTNGMLPAAGTYAFIGIGGAVLVGDIVALIVLSVKHQKSLRPLLEWVSSQTSNAIDRNWWAAIFQYLEPQPGTDKNINCFTEIVASCESLSEEEDSDESLSARDKELYSILIRTAESKSVHIFERESEWANFSQDLHTKKYIFKEYDPK